MAELAPTRRRKTRLRGKSAQARGMSEAMTNAEIASERRHKYGVAAPERRTADGILFASRAEMRRYEELRLLERGGEIDHLELQPRFPLVVNGVTVGTYVADFRYRDGRTGLVCVTDVKGVRTPLFRLKVKLVKALYGIDVIEERV